MLRFAQNEPTTSRVTKMQPAKWGGCWRVWSSSMGYKNVTREVGRQSEGVTQTPWVTKMWPAKRESIPFLLYLLYLLILLHLLSLPLKKYLPSGNPLGRYTMLRLFAKYIFYWQTTDFRQVCLFCSAWQMQLVDTMVDSLSLCLLFSFQEFIAKLII